MNSDYWEQVEQYLQQHIAHFGNRIFIAPIPARVKSIEESEIQTPIEEIYVTNEETPIQQEITTEQVAKGLGYGTSENIGNSEIANNMQHENEQILTVQQHQNIPMEQTSPQLEPQQEGIELHQGIASTVEPWQNTESLTELFSCIHTCKECKLGATRNNFVFGVGNPNADIMVVGEAPGADEDAQGEPFVGRAGQLLTKILAAINLSRSDVYIANIIKCRPPGNRVPEKDEVAQCEPYLHKQIALIKPKFILALGLTAANTLLKSKFKMSEVRGKTFPYHGATMLVTYHPAALLRNPEWKRGTWEDVQKLRDMWLETLPK